MFGSIFALEFMITFNLVKILLRGDQFILVNHMFFNNGNELDRRSGLEMEVPCKINDHDQ